MATTSGNHEPVLEGENGYEHPTGFGMFAATVVNVAMMFAATMMGTMVVGITVVGTRAMAATGTVAGTSMA
jgi:hypothetical protein